MRAPALSNTTSAIVAGCAASKGGSSATGSKAAGAVHARQRASPRGNAPRVMSPERRSTCPPSRGRIHGLRLRQSVVWCGRGDASARDGSEWPARPLTRARRRGAPAAPGAGALGARGGERSRRCPSPCAPRSYAWTGPTPMRSHGQARAASDWIHLVGILKETRSSRYADAHERPAEALGRAAEKAGRAAHRRGQHPRRRARAREMRASPRRAAQTPACSAAPCPPRCCACRWCSGRTSSPRPRSARARARRWRSSCEAARHSSSRSTRAIWCARSSCALGAPVERERARPRGARVALRSASSCCGSRRCSGAGPPRIVPLPLAAVSALACVLRAHERRAAAHARHARCARARRPHRSGAGRAPARPRAHAARRDAALHLRRAETS